MSKVRAVTTLLAPLLVLGTMAVGLRLGAEPAGVAAQVIPSPAPSSRSHLVWQIRVLREERRIRDAAARIPLEVHAVHGKNQAFWKGVSNEEGIAEAVLSLADVPPGDVVAMEVRTSAGGDSGADRWRGVVAGGGVLARGEVRVPGPASPTPITPLRATQAEGPLHLEVYAPAGGVPPQFESTVWIRGGDGSPGAVPALGTLSVESDPGLEVSPPPVTERARCASGLMPLTVRAMGHVLGLRLSLTDAQARRSSWYGALPVVPGGDELTIEAAKEKQPVTLRVRAASAKPLVYVEVTDEVGRVFAESRNIEPGAGGFGEAKVTVPGLPRGTYFAVVSSRPDGFHLGTAVARGFRVEGDGELPLLSCDRAFEMTVRPPPIFDRAVALDGFVLRREEAAKIRAKGMRLAVGSLIIGGLLAAFILATSIRRSTPKLDPDNPEAEALARSTPPPRWLLVVLLGGLSCLAYFLLAVLVLYSGN